jgi:60 kDa SS-A/Ro ribonucleoprotein
MRDLNWRVLENWLIFGCADAVYRAGVDEAASPAAVRASVAEYLAADGRRVVAAIESLAKSRRPIPRAEPMLIALAAATSPKYSPGEVNSAALAAAPAVLRTAQDLCKFVGYARPLRGWGRGLRSAVGRWYLAQPLGELASQMLRCAEQQEWTHRDLLRMSHPKPRSTLQNALFQWVVEGELGHLAPSNIAATELRPVYVYERARKSVDEREVIQLIEQYRATDEMIPAEWKRSSQVWEALLEFMPYPAVLRNLEAMAATGLLESESPATALAVARLMDRRRIQESRIHPVAVAEKRLSYSMGANAAPMIVDALATAERMAMDQLRPAPLRVHIDAAGARTQKAKVLALALRRMFEPADDASDLRVVFDAAGIPASGRTVVILDSGEQEIPMRPDLLVIYGIDSSVPGVVADFLRTG